ncbi:MAG TPA: ABC transporter substrate-binding protein, partial [Acidimicrobiia bacterium]|nr:ABC transporter substrate-binding protein [Acidimicrobiia bacterium]
MIGRRPKVRATAALAVVLVAGGCGSRVDRDRLAAAGGGLSLSSAQHPAAGASAGSPPASSVASRADGSPLAGAPATGIAAGGIGAPAGATGGAAGATAAAPQRAAGRFPARTATPGASPVTPAGTSGSAAGGGAGPGGGGDGAATGAAGTGSIPGTPGAPGKPGPGAARAPIVFGTFGTGSGVIGRAVQPIITADKAWSADINARGGLAGHPVKLIFGDDGGDPAAALAIAKRMVEQDKVVAFIGTYLVTTTPAVTPYLEQVGVPMIGGPGGNEIEDHSPMVFNPQIGSDEALGHGIHLAVTSQTDKRRMAILYCREASSCKQQRDRALQFAGLYGMTIVYEAQVSIA